MNQETFKPKFGQYSISNEKKARECLRGLLASFDINNISIQNHHHIESHDNFLVSLSHCDQASVAYLVNREEQSEITSVGVDVESIDRKISTDVYKYFVDADDYYSNILELWCVKEAIFKAINPIYPRCSKLSDIIVNSDKTFYAKDNKNINGRYEFNVRDNLVLAFAVVDC